MNELRIVLEMLAAIAIVVGIVLVCLVFIKGDFKK